MTATAPSDSKVTYTSAHVDWNAFHRQFDEALADVRARAGRDYPLYIGGKAVTSSAKPIIEAGLSRPHERRRRHGRTPTGTSASRFSIARPP